MVRVRVRSPLSGKVLAVLLIAVSVPISVVGVYVLAGLGWSLICLAAELALLGLFGTNVDRGDQP